MAWTKVSKPSSTSYTNVNFTGKQEYDQFDVTYDDASTYYDSFNPSMWTSVAKPTGGGTFQIQIGMATGLITPPTYATSHPAVSTDPWHKVAKPT